MSRLRNVTIPQARKITRYAGLALVALVTLAIAVPSASAVEAGSIDRSFGQNGFYTSNPSVDTDLKDMAVSTDGRIAFAHRNENWRFLATRLTADGQLDPAFGLGGSFSPSSPQSEQNSEAQITILPSGDVVMATTIFGGRCEQVARIGSGSWESWSTFTNCQQQEIFALGAGNQERVYVAGWEGSTASHETAIWRHTPSGSRDSAFGTLKLGTGNAVDVDVLPDGASILTGVGEDTVFVARVTPSGSLDTTFGTAGKVDFGDVRWCGTEVAPDGAIVVCTEKLDEDSLLNRLNPAGQPDTNFGVRGVLELTDQYVHAIAVDRQGRVVLSLWRGSAWVVERYGIDGRRERTLVENSMAITPPDWHPAIPSRIVIQPSGRILLVARSQPRYADWMSNQFPYGFFISALHPETVTPPPPPPPPAEQVKDETPRVSSACLKARAGEKRARRVVKKTQQRLKKAKRATAKRRVQKQLKKKRAVLRKAKAKRIRACR